MNYKIYILIYLIILLHIVKGISLTKKEILDMDLSPYSTVEGSEKCPEYGQKNNAMGYYCHFTFYCLDNNNCQSDNEESPYFEFNDKDGSIKKFIRATCPKNDERCITEKCTTDSDCLSNKCFNGRCVSGKSRFTECSDVINRDDVQAMKCGKPDGATCYRNGNCAGKCLEGICYSHERLSSTAEIDLSIFIILTAIVICHYWRNRT